VVLLQGGLSRLPHAFAVGERAMAHMWRGLGLIIVPNAVAIALGALGVLSPPVAAVVNNSSTLFASLAGLQPLLGRTAPAEAPPSSARPNRTSCAVPSPARHPGSGSPVEEFMTNGNSNNSVTPLFSEPDGQPANGGGETPVMRFAPLVLIPVVALGGGAGIVAAAVAWGAAETAVGVGSAYLLYTTLTGRAGALTGAVQAGVRALTFVAKRLGLTEHGEHTAGASPRSAP
jgi:hypothetical protein